MTSQERTILLILASINFTHILDYMIMMPLGNYLMPEFGIDAGYFAQIVASYNFAAFATGIIAAFLVDRYDRKKVLLFGYIGFLAGTLCCAFAPTPILLIIARVVAGLFGGLIGAQVLSIVADLFSYERRGRAMSWLISAFSVASVLGVPLSLYLARFINWHAPFYFIVIVGVFVLPAIFKFIPSVSGHVEGNAGKIDFKGTVLSIFSIPAQRAALLFSGALMMGHFFIIPFINPYMEFNVGYTKTQTPIIYLVGGLTTLVGSFVWGRLADQYGKLVIFTITGLLSVIPVFVITRMPLGWSFALTLLPFAFWFGMANGRTISSQAMVSQVVQPRNRGSFMSMNSSIQQLFTGLASTIAGIIVFSDASNKIYNYHLVGYASVFVILVCIVLARRLGVK